MKEKITVSYEKPSSGERREHTLTVIDEYESKHKHVISCDSNRVISPRGKVRIHVDTGKVYHQDPRYDGIIHSVQIGRNAEIAN